MASAPSFTATPRAALIQVTAANTARDGTGTTVDLITGAATGTRIEHIDITAAGTTTTGVVRLFLYDGTNTRLWMEILVTAITPSTSIKPFSATINLSLPSVLMILLSGWKIKASTHNAETFNINCVGGDF